MAAFLFCGVYGTRMDLFLVSYRKRASFHSAWRPSGSALTLRVRPNTIEPELPFNGSLSVFYKPVVSLAEMVVTKESVICR